MQKNSLPDHVNAQFDKIRYETGPTVVKHLSREERQYQLLVTMDTLTREQSKLMPDFELADKARATTLLQMFSIIGDKLGFVVSFPPELANKSVAQVLHVLDFIDDNEKLNAIDY